MNADECCLVCAEPLQWVGIGSCGHREVCANCTSRWRFVMKDTRCMVCKQELESVFFTRHMGDYTARPEFDDLQARAAKGELQTLPDIGGYFDDVQLYNQIKALVGYTHPTIVERCKADGKEAPSFNSFPAMKRFAEQTLNLRFCDICVKGRKVFLCEQQLYTKPELDRHMRKGDDRGALADTSFKGHPLCEFCCRRFYDSTELYRHMETDHFHCFLCRRINPREYVYFKTYDELEDHFRSGHHLCPHASCLEKKFVVFAHDHELKRHIATEHGDELKMSRAARREAMTLPLQLQYGTGGVSGPGDGSSSPAAPHPGSGLLDRPGVVIGGGYNVTSRHGNRAAQHQNQNQAGGGMRHSHSTGEMGAALAASMVEQDAARSRAARGGRRGAPALAADAAASGVDAGDASTFDARRDVSSLTFSADDFPSVSGSAAGLPMTGRWGGMGGASGGPSTSSGLTQDNFPALPSLSKAARRRAREQQASLADQLRAANMPVRVVSRARPSSAAPPAGQAAAPSSQPPHLPPPPQPPALGHSRSAVSLSSGSTAAGANGRTSPAPALGFERASSGGLGSPPAPMAAVAAAAPPSPFRAPAVIAPQAPPAPEDFPSLPGASTGGSAASRPPVPAPAPPRYTNTTLDFLRGSVPSAPSTSTASAATTAAPQVPPSMSDFPDLPTSAAPSKAGKGKGTKAGAAGRSTVSEGRTTGATRANGSASGSRPEAGPLSPSRESGGGSAVAGGSSRSLQEANKQLISKIQQQLRDDAAFAQFKQESGGFLKGEVSAADYHKRILSLGLLSLVPELAALCPNTAARDALLTAHRVYVSSPEAQSPGPGAAGWVPPEAAMAAADAAAAHASWTCPRCTLLNAPSAVVCEVCGATAEGFSQPQDAFPGLSAVYGGGSGSAKTSSGRGQGAGSSSQQQQQSTATLDVQEDGTSGGSSGGSAKKKGKGTKITIGLGAGTGARAAPTPAAPAVNAWSAAGAGPSNGAPQAPGQGSWAPTKGGGKVTKLHHALNDAWGSR